MIPIGYINRKKNYEIVKALFPNDLDSVQKFVVSGENRGVSGWREKSCAHREDHTCNYIRNLLFKLQHYL